MATDDRVKAACKVVGCNVKDLLTYRLTDDAVVLIVGPAGGKHVVPFSDLGAPPPVTTQVEAKEKPVRASKAAKKRSAKKAAA